MSEEEVLSYGNSNEICYADWSSIHKLTFSYWWEEATLKNGKTRTIQQSEWKSPSTWGQPDIAVYEVPWETVKTETKLLTAAHLKRLRGLSERDPVTFEREVSFLRRQLPRKRKAVRTRYRRASDKSFQNLARVVDNLETAESVAVFFRDRSIDTLLIGATMMSGGAALAVLGTGSALSGVGEYQDSGNAGKALVKTIGTFTMGVIPGGPGRPAAEKVATMFIGASLDGVEALAAGKSGEQALVSAALGVAGGLIGDAGGDAIERFVKTPNGRRLLAKSAAVHRIPLTVPISRKARDVVGRGKIASAVINKYMVNAPIDAVKGRIVDSMVKPGQKKTAPRGSRGVSVSAAGVPVKISGGTVQYEPTPGGGTRMTIKGKHYTSVTDRSLGNTKTRYYSSGTGRELFLHEPRLQDRIESLLLAPE